MLKSVDLIKLNTLIILLTCAGNALLLHFHYTLLGAEAGFLFNLCIIKLSHESRLQGTTRERTV